MAKGFRLVMVLLVTVISFSTVHGQTRKFNNNYKPIPVIKRLSYENFKNIKLLQTAIMNYGGGNAEVDRLVDQYAEASALYFQNKYEEAANLFTENSREILKVSQKLAQIYKEDTDKLIKEAIKLNIKSEFANSLEGKKKNEVAAKCLDNAQFGYTKANDLYDRFINATTASPSRLVNAIYYYRRAKENIFLMYQRTEMDKNKEKDKQKKQEMLAKYKKDIEDNKNKIFKSMEKKN